MVELLTAYRPGKHIIEEDKDDTRFNGEPDQSQLGQPEESNWHGTEAARSTLRALLKEDYKSAMGLWPHRGPVDGFFEKVTVNAEESALRVNRLKLLSVSGNDATVADFNQIEG